VDSHFEICRHRSLKKENDILLRGVGKKRVHFSIGDKLFIVVLNRAADIKQWLTLVKPETLLDWQRTRVRRFWTFQHAPAKRGRKPVETDLKNLILSMKNDNLLWGVKRIQGELLKLDISLSTKTIRKILQAFRRRGKIRSSLTWKKFLETQIQFIYALDNFLLTGRSQIERILDEYVDFYNGQRPHQGIQQQIPCPDERGRMCGAVRKSAVLGGLHHHSLQT
jgi:hypothetical protein